MDRKKREQYIVYGGGGITILLLYLLIFVFPSLDSIKDHKKRIAAGEKEMQELKTLLETHKKSSAVPSHTFEGSLSVFVEQKAKETGITIGMIKPYTGDREGVEIKLDDVETNKMLRFLYEMELHGISVSRLRMNDHQGTGQWEVRINVEAGPRKRQTPGRA